MPYSELLADAEVGVSSLPIGNPHPRLLCKKAQNSLPPAVSSLKWGTKEECPPAGTAGTLDGGEGKSPTGVLHLPCLRFRVWEPDLRHLLSAWDSLLERPGRPQVPLLQQ